MKFRAKKRPLVVIDAIRFDSMARAQEISDWSGGEFGPKKIAKARIGDWIIRGQEYGFYTCKNKIFQERYEPIDEGDLKPGDLVEL